LNEFKDFILAGHCLGGYIAGNYSLKYRHFIKKLLLLSPIGCRPLDADEEDMTDYELEQ
jgi:pimeloyl-ACP methyl ester carboxylesterase